MTHNGPSRQQTNYCDYDLPRRWRWWVYQQVRVARETATTSRRHWRRRPPTARQLPVSTNRPCPLWSHSSLTTRRRRPCGNDTTTILPVGTYSIGPYQLSTVQSARWRLGSFFWFLAWARLQERRCQQILVVTDKNFNSVSKHNICCSVKTVVLP